MPVNVRLFWWITVGIAVYSLTTAIWFATFSSAHELAALAKLSADIRVRAQHVDVISRLTASVIWGGVTVWFAWLAAYRRVDWARWIFALVFVAQRAIPFVIFFFYAPWPSFARRLSFAAENGFAQLRTDPVFDGLTALTILSIILVFSPNARPWFARRAARSAD